ncbi:unnamed protein product [Didymodactylos carnosus]|uniref:Integrase catalytic domain-containing protein n=1 Tax=Didymodactylos carnosus TaxID=1234261 RepID=A0A814ZLS7_9BILA|nr:unnamed protein product [Didymodactylos carnosus]CAF4008043.1 unnamed protein product [Didymodactylos carnosus]
MRYEEYLLGVPREDSGTQLDSVAPGNNGSIVASVALADRCIASSANATEVNDLAVASDAVVSGSVLAASVVLHAEKGKSVEGVNGSFVFWSRKNFILREISGIEIESHETISYGGRDKTLAEILAHYSWIPKIVLEIYMKYCLPCQHRKSVKTPVLVVLQKKLRELFFTFGPPKLLHSDNGAEFVADVITALKLLFPDMCFIRGRRRYPQSQGLVERGNGVFCDSLGKWMSSTNSEHWSDGLLPVVYGINTRVACGIKCTPYEVIFGQKPHSDSDFWRIIKDQNIEDEDMLPVPIETQQESGESTSDYALIDEALAAANSILVFLFRHESVRQQATNNILTAVQKKRKLYDEHLTQKAKQYKVGDCVSIQISDVDRTNIDVKLLPCLILSKDKKDADFIFRTACKFGKLAIAYMVESLIDLRSACPTDLKLNEVSSLGEITVIEAAKLLVRGAVSGVICDCKTKCGTKHCPCKKVGVACSTKCHVKQRGCLNST